MFNALTSRPSSPPLAYAQPPANGTSQGHPHSDQYAAYFSHFSQPVPPPELRPVVDKTAEYVAKNSDGFERTVLERHIGDVRFSFLNPWDQFYPYYQLMKQYSRARLQQGGAPYEGVELQQEKHNMQKLSSIGTVSFKLQGKSNPSTLALPGPSSEFGAEESLENMTDMMEEGNLESECPPTKKQRVENGASQGAEEGEDDDIGRTVQVSSDWFGDCKPNFKSYIRDVTSSVTALSLCRHFWTQ